MTATGLRRFLEPRAPDVARCELCAAPTGEGHGHVVNTESRALLCACRACYLLFTHDAGEARRFRAVPERYLYLPSFRLSAADWEALRIPVRTAFFFHNSVLGRVAAFYPSPGGATESELPPAAWERVLAANPELPEALPDVEALLVDHGPDGFGCHLVPIDACYELVGLVRTRWKGFDGGQDAWEAIEGFFAELRGRAKTGGGDG